jgi:hypothetical protein
LGPSINTAPVDSNCLERTSSVILGIYSRIVLPPDYPSIT